jgi:hypothetical protein
VSRERSAVIAVALVALALLPACGDDVGEPEPLDGFGADWPSFTDEALGIEFAMPAAPERLVQRVQLPDGTQSEIVVHAVEAGSLELFVSSFPVDPDAYELAGAAEGAAAAVGGEVVSDEPVTVSGTPGRDAEIRYQLDGVERVLLYRAMLLENGLVQMQTLGPTDARADVEAHHRALVSRLVVP